MNLPGFTADTAIYKSKWFYSMRGLIGSHSQSQVKPAMYPGWEQMHPFIDPFWGWRPDWTGDSIMGTKECSSGNCMYGKIVAVCEKGQRCVAGCDDYGFPYARCVG